MLLISSCKLRVMQCLQELAKDFKAKAGPLERTAFMKNIIESA